MIREIRAVREFKESEWLRIIVNSPNYLDSLNSLNSLNSLTSLNSLLSLTIYLQKRRVAIAQETEIVLQGIVVNLMPIVTNIGTYKK